MVLFLEQLQIMVTLKIWVKELITFAGSGENFPGTGHLLVTGADNATLLLRTIDDVNVEIDADYDGDGAVDETLFLTWVELEDQG